MLKILTDACAASGIEDEVREIVLKEIKPFCDDVRVDKMGNVIAFKKGRHHEKVFMADAHMDEVGFIVKNVTEDGYIKFDEIGGIDERQLPGSRVLVGKNKISGVIGVKPIHLTSKDERKSVKKMSDSYIDIGAKSREEALKLVSKGDHVYFDSEYTEFGEGLIKAKALDDRVGVAVLIDMLKNAQPFYDFYAVFSVQEEIGCRGAKVAAAEVKPDYALVVEGTICADSCLVPPHLQVTCTGDGAVFSVIENSSLADRDMLEFAKKVAQTENIKYQLKRTNRGGNDAGVIQTSLEGCKTLAMAVPCRYLHSSGCVISETDFECVRKLAQKICERIGEIC